MSGKRYLIVNADDFGLSPGVNEGIIVAHEHGIVTSASLMVRWPAAGDAGKYARQHPSLDLGLHVDLGEWFCRDGSWMPRYEVVPPGDGAAATQEITRQLETFRHLVNADPTHLDSHQHVHLQEPVRSILAELAHELGVPLRDCTPDIHYCGSFYGQTTEGEPLPEIISVAGLSAILTELPPGITELGCHPGRDAALDSTYAAERAREVEVLCDRRSRALLAANGIELGSFRERNRRRFAGDPCE
jgi:chitin disaccharide deacetylase